jgi:hypothetical protein
MSLFKLAYDKRQMMIQVHTINLIKLNCVMYFLLLLTSNKEVFVPYFCRILFCYDVSA